MVDTINPQTGKEDNFDPTTVNTPQPQTANTGGFYSGFDKPEAVHVNLAATSENQAQPAATASVQAENNAQLDSINTSNTSNVPVEPSHGAYVASGVNFKSLLIYIGVGLMSIVVIGFLALLGSNAYFGSKLKTEENYLAELNKTLEDLKNEPEALVLPEVEVPATETPAAENPVTEAPAEEEPETIPTPAVSPSATGSGQG